MNLYDTCDGKAKVNQSGTGKNEAKAALGGYYREFLTGGTKNARDVWTIPVVGFPEAHFATCAACDQALYPHPARPTDVGYVHVSCPARTCRQCHSTLSAKAVTGLCKRCYQRLRLNCQLDVIEAVARPSCRRCGLSGAALCDDCLDVAADLRELGRWVA